ncbi:MAG: hypothetical protein ABIT83_11980 [Massilia sp.]
MLDELVAKWLKREDMQGRPHQNDAARSRQESFEATKNRTIIGYPEDF